jgi:hypothetical protein
MRPVFVAVLCVISAAIGAGINHYWDNLPWFAGADKDGLRSFTGASAPEAKSTTANPSGGGSVEVRAARKSVCITSLFSPCYCYSSRIHRTNFSRFCRILIRFRGLLISSFALHAGARALPGPDGRLAQKRPHGLLRASCPYRYEHGYWPGARPGRCS